MSRIVVTDEAGAPATPAAGVTVFYSVGGVLYTLDSSGVPRTFLTTAVLTTLGDLLYQGASPSRLPIGTPGQLLRVSAGNIPEWATVGASDVGAVAVSLFTTNGDLAYRDGAGAVVRLGAGAPGTVLTIDGGGIPAWAASAVPSVPWTALITEGLITTVDATPTAVVTEAEQAAAGGILFDFEVTALYRDLSAMYSWKVLATVRDDGAGTINLQDAVITPTDPGGPLAIGVSIVGTDLVVTATGVIATTIDWFKSGSRKFHPQGP